MRGCHFFLEIVTLMQSQCRHCNDNTVYSCSAWASLSIKRGLYRFSCIYTRGLCYTYCTRTVTAAHVVEYRPWDATALYNWQTSLLKCLHMVGNIALVASSLCHWDQWVPLGPRDTDFIILGMIMSCTWSLLIIPHFQRGTRRHWSRGRHCTESVAVCCHGNSGERRAGQLRFQQLTEFLPPHSSNVK